jgi:hypothetical protein
VSAVRFRPSPQNPENVMFLGFFAFATTLATKYGLNKGKKHPYKEAKLVHENHHLTQPFFAYLHLTVKTLQPL